LKLSFLKKKKTEYEDLWSDSERAAWALPERMTVSQWADRYRQLSESSAEPGQWRTDRVPYLRGIMDTFSDPLIERIVLKTSTQVGKTETMNNIAGYIVDQDPGPILYVLPTKEDSEDVALHTIKPFVLSNDVILQHLDPDRDSITKKKFVFDRMIMYVTGAGSPSSLARRPIRYLIMDEVNKFPPFSGREADPLKLARERQRTYWNRKTVIASTPTTPEGYITREYEKSDKRQFYVPCPHCGHYQTLIFNQLKFPKDVRDPMHIKLEQLAWYECGRCKSKILDKHKHEMLISGRWVCEGQKIDKKGKITGERKMTDVAGFHITALYSPFLSFSDIAAEWLECQGDVGALMNFINSWLAEEFEEKTQQLTTESLKKNIGVYHRGFVPDRAFVLTAGIDKQQDHFLFAVYAWGYGEEAWLVREGRLETWEQVTQAIFMTKYFRADRKNFLDVRLACFDSGYDTDEVYDYCRANSPQARATKGQQHQRAPWYASKIDSHPLKGGKIAQGLTLWHLDTSFFKEKIHRHINTPQGETGCWHFHREVTEDFLQQISAEVKSVFVDKRTKRRREEWRLRTSGAANHYLDCTVNAAAAADMLGIRFLSKDQAEEMIRQSMHIDAGKKPDDDDRSNDNWVTGWRR